MPLSRCISSIGADGRELLAHGTSEFPIACYHDDLLTEPVYWHWHEELEAVVVTQGCTEVTVGKRKFLAREGEGFFINTGILHACRSGDGKPCRFHSIVFHSRLVGGSMESVFHQKYIRPLLEAKSLECVHLTREHSDCLEAIEEAWQACTREPPGYELQIRSALSRLVWLLREGIHDHRQPPNPRELRDAERIKGMLQYIQCHYPENITNRAVAQSAAISESECLRCFRSTIGMTPNRYLQHYRIQQAAQLLTGSELPVSDIAAQCGFQDMSYFAKLFRRFKGCTPSQFRQQLSL